jgi:hypothetical protein
MGEAGPSGAGHDTTQLAMPAHANAAGNHDDYGLSKLRRSHHIADYVDQVRQQQWGSNHVQQFIVDEESDDDDEEEEEEEEEEELSDEEADSDSFEQENECDAGCRARTRRSFSMGPSGQRFLKRSLEVRSVIMFITVLMADTFVDDKVLDESDLSLLCAYSLKVEDGLTDKMFNKLRFAFPQALIDTLKNTKKCIQSLSGFRPVHYDCCTSSCICYTGPYETLLKCPKCNTDRYKADGMTPQAYFQYLPIIPWLHAMVSNSPYARKMQYRASHQHDPTKVTDIFDGAHYFLLRESFVTVGGEKLPNWFFSDPRDVALGLPTDGFGPFKHRTKTAWPIILFNYNLPSEERILKKNIISVGVIPGPKKPGDSDSFLWPLVQELLQLELGVSAFDAITTTVFLLRAYLIVVFGDIPAVSMIMCMKGHNGCSPCRMCEIQGICIPSSQVTTHYVPLHHENFPNSQHQYDATALPLRNHASFIEQAQEVQSALTNAASE